MTGIEIKNTCPSEFALTLMNYLICQFPIHEELIMKSSSTKYLLVLNF